MKLTDQVKDRFTGEIIGGGFTLEDILRRHEEYIEYHSEGGELTVLENADLRWADLSGRKLENANLKGSDLSFCNLSYANLSETDLSSVNLYGASLYKAVLCYSNMSDSVLSGANLNQACLYKANLNDSDIIDAPFKIENINQKIYEYALINGVFDTSAISAVEEITIGRCELFVDLAGDAGRALEWCYGTEVAAGLIYFASDQENGSMPNIFWENQRYLQELKKRAEQEASENEKI